MSKIEMYIPQAIKAVDEMIASKNGRKVPSAYNGYISAMGASMIQSGLLPTLALYENKEAKTIADKAMLSKVILKVLDQNSQDNSLLKYVLRRKNEEAVLKQKIIDIAIAIKLAIRTFELEK